MQVAEGFAQAPEVRGVIAEVVSGDSGRCSAMSGSASGSSGTIV